MKKTTKNLISIFLALVMMLTIIPMGVMTASAATPESDFEFSDGTITSYNGSDTNIVFPSKIGGVTVKTIGSYAFYNNDAIKSVTIPASVTTIDDSAFMLCENLASVKFSKNSKLKVIGYGAFEYNAFEEITIPASVTTIGGYALGDNDYLKTVKFESDSKLTSIGEQVFYQDSELKHIYLTTTVPPTIEDNWYIYDTICEQVKIHVPTGYEKTYKKAWPKYADVIYKAPPAWLNTISTKVDAASYDLVTEVNGTSAPLKPFLMGYTLKELYDEMYKANCSKNDSVYTIKGGLGTSMTEIKVTLYSDGDIKKVTWTESYEGVVYESYVFAIPHTCKLAKKNGKAATCTEDGWKAYYQCTGKHCGKIYASNKTSGKSYASLKAWKASKAGKIAKKGHKYTSKVTKKATYSADGVRTYTCSSCGKKYTKVIPKLKATAAAKYNSSTKMNASFKVSSSTKNVTVKWGKVAGADGYMIYANYCGTDTKPVLIKTIKGEDTKTYSFSKMNGKKIDLTKNFKVYVVAYANINGKKVEVGRTIIGHVVGGKSKKYTNSTKITVKNSNVTLAVNKTSTIKATVTYKDANKKPVDDSHAPEKRYRSSDKAVATVDENGKIKAVGKGTCTIYVFAKNGTSTKVTVKVK